MRLRFMYLTGRLLIFLSVIIIFLANLSSHANAAVAADPITVSSETATLNFPKFMDFQLDAHDAVTPLEIATLSIDFNFTHMTEVHPVTHTQAHDVLFQWHEDFDEQHFMPVGTIVTYHWTIADINGHQYNSEAKKFQITDTRFQWQHLSQGLYQINWYNRPADFGQILLTQATDSLKRISTNLGTQLKQPINLWVYETNDDFHSSLPRDTVEWVGGVAFYTLNQASVVVGGPDDITLSRDLPHELTHLVFHQTAQGIIPTWFDEGLAVYNQSYHEADMQNQFKDELTKHSLISLDDLKFSFPRDAQKAYQAYSQSWKLVDYMYATFGLKKMAALIQNTHRTDQSFDTDLQKSLGVDSQHLENQWHIRLNQPATLSGTEQTQQPTTQPIDSKPTAVSVDTTNTYLVAAGTFLIVVPIIGCVLLLIYVLSSRRKARTLAAAQQMHNYMHTGNYINIIRPDIQQYNSHYTQPSAYTTVGPQGPAEQNAITADRVPLSYSTYQPYPWGNPEVKAAEEPKPNIEE